MAAKVKVRLFNELRSVMGHGEVELEADSLNDVLESLIRKDESLKELLFDSKGDLRHYILFYVNNGVQTPVDLSRKLKDGDLVLVVPPAAGGLS